MDENVEKYSGLWLAEMRKSLFCKHGIFMNWVVCRQKGGFKSETNWTRLFTWRSNMDKTIRYPYLSIHKLLQFYPNLTKVQ